MREGIEISELRWRWPCARPGPRSCTSSGLPSRRAYARRCRRGARARARPTLHGVTPRGYPAPGGGVLPAPTRSSAKPSVGPSHTTRASRSLITDMHAAVDGARLLLHEAAWRIDRGLPCAAAAAAAFAEAVDASLLVGPNGVQILGRPRVHAGPPRGEVHARVPAARSHPGRRGCRARGSGTRARRRPFRRCALAHRGPRDGLHDRQGDA